jgi:acyl dehydratase
MSSLLYWEDLAVGQIWQLGPTSVSRDEIVAFAARYDPQRFHLDEEAALATPYGGIIASGWHTMSIVQRLVVEGLLGRAACLGAAGVEQLRWRRPVRPDDSLRLRLEIMASAPSVKRPDERGTVDVLHELFNQREELVMTMRARVLFARRPAP